mmetsp:Transcript_10775/g.36565  ORF Transcript_10775/g.36565 Transcript_10775/m.36565 type:complete len:201 (-) Transcript_10775:238-840(-)
MAAWPRTCRHLTGRGHDLATRRTHRTVAGYPPEMQENTTLSDRKQAALSAATRAHLDALRLRRKKPTPPARATTTTTTITRMSAAKPGPSIPHWPQYHVSALLEMESMKLSPRTSRSSKSGPPKPLPPQHRFSNSLVLSRLTVVPRTVPSKTTVVVPCSTQVHVGLLVHVSQLSAPLVAHSQPPSRSTYWPSGQLLMASI